jgi:hypothetical protein
MSRVQEKRVARKSLFQRGPQSISGEKDPNYVYRFVNDTGSRVANFQSAGYELVQDDSLVVGDSRVFDPSDIGSAKKVTSNDGTTSYLMRIKKEWHDEDQKAKQEHINETERAMKQQATQGSDYGEFKVSRDK